MKAAGTTTEPKLHARNGTGTKLVPWSMSVVGWAAKAQTGLTALTLGGVVGS